MSAHCAGERRLIGWELAFGGPDGANLADGDESSDVYFAAAMEFAKTASWDSLLCGGRGLIRADRRLVFSDIIEHMPSNRLVSSRGESFEPTPRFAQSLRDSPALLWLFAARSA
ncbi:MAG: hypothetical protein ACKVIW_03140 [bacterium]